MPHHKSAAKRIKTNLKRQIYNTHYKSMLKTLIKNILSITDKATGEQQLKKVYSLLDKLAQKNVIHKNKAANQKARLSKFVASLS